MLPLSVNDPRRPPSSHCHRAKWLSLSSAPSFAWCGLARPGTQTLFLLGVHMTWALRASLCDGRVLGDQESQAAHTAEAAGPCAHRRRTKMAALCVESHRAG